MKQMISPAQYLASLNEKEREEAISSLSQEALATLKYSWKFWARPDQLEPEGEEWITWLILAGRGWGKTRVGAETIRDWVCGPTPLAAGKCSRIALVAETAGDARDVMVEGESGLLSVHPPEFRPEYSPSNRKLTWPNGAVAYTYNATQPDQLRGPQHDAAWCDELAKWQYMQDAWDQLQFGLRLGDRPRQIVTTTPRPLPLIRKLVADELTYITRGRTYDNAANLAAPFLKQIEDRYGNTRLGRQELEGEILDDVPGALWTRASIDDHRLQEAPTDIERIFVSVDPATSSEENSDEHGIVVVGLRRDNEGVARGYVLEDGSCKGSPEDWARRAVYLYRKWSCDKIIAEKNQGGDMVAHTIKSVDRNVPVELVHASRGKVIRAEPISALYEQGRIHHCGRFDQLEDQMTTFSIDYDRKHGSPDRMDALVWGFTKLFDKLTGRVRREAAEDEIRRKNIAAGGPTYWDPRTSINSKQSWMM